ncbi:MAG: porin [Pirellulaceae bacterium]|nr:porin [Pirellulaceae bacterium]
MKVHLYTIVAVATLLCAIAPCIAQTPALGDLDRLQLQLDEQANTIRELTDRLNSQDERFGRAPATDSKSCTPDSVLRLPLVCQEPIDAGCDDSGSDARVRKLDYYADYNKGFAIRPFDPSKNPFSLKTNFWVQFRHHAFAREDESWTDNAGVTRPVRSRNAFDLERARLVFSGFAIDPRLTYFLQLDGDTDGSHAVDFFDFWWGWKFSDRFRVQVGRRKVTGSRQWLLTARRTRFTERPMANDFFRPDRTVGIFGFGSFGDTGKYQLTFGNTHRTNTPESRSDNRLMFAATSFFDPLGAYGNSIVDEEVTDQTRVRLGHSVVYSQQRGRRLGVPFDEANFVRLSDGTRLTQIGALSPGVTVSEFDLYSYGVDAAIKWNGWSMNAEYFARWIEQIEGDGPVPTTDLFQHGHYVEGGYFLVPKRFDVNGRYSQVGGEFGTRSEYAIGCNWYPLAKQAIKLSFDVTTLDGSPLQNTASNILAGDDGTLYRSQFQAEF